MNRIPIKRKTAQIIDYTLWGLAVVLAFMVDWKAGVSLLCFDLMRVFEDVQNDIDKENAEKENQK